MDAATLIVNIGLLVATAGATAIAWGRAIAAGRSQKAAETAEEAALAAWKEASTALVRANSIADVASRGPYAWMLHEMGSAVLSARMVGETPEQLRQLVTDRARGLAEKSYSVGDVSTSEITSWVSYFTRFSVLEGVDAWMDSVLVLGERVRLWQLDPEAAIKLIAEDPRYISPYG